MPSRFVFGGVVFELPSALCSDWGRLPGLARVCAPGEPAIARVRLELERFVPRSVEGSANRGPRRVYWQHEPAGVSVRAGDVAASVAQDRLGGPHFVATARTPRVAGWLEHVCSAVHAAVVFARGGLVLHAASVWHRGRVWAFLGPSGAGKSTAAHTLGGAVYSVDRLVLWPPGPASWVSALPGGTPRVGAEPPRCEAARLPLEALVRVRQAPAGTARIEALSPLRAFSTLRESVFFGAKDAESHQALLVAIERACASVVVAELCFGLGAALSHAFAKPPWLRERP